MPHPRPIGFSTGALARGDFRSALTTLRAHRVDAVELSALRSEELEPLLQALPTLDLTGFTYVSLHAPSRFTAGDEEAQIVAQLLSSAAANRFPIVVHPDVIFEPARWRPLHDRLLLENMDKRKPIGRTVNELAPLFHELPDARFCFDIGHARQVDPTMTEATLLLRAFGDRLAEIHLSEVNTASRHDPISHNAIQTFRQVATRIPEHVPIILEPLIDRGQSDLETEIQRAQEVFAPTASLAITSSR
jgi:hypothetical protein